jgi:integrase
VRAVGDEVEEPAQMLGGPGGVSSPAGRGLGWGSRGVGDAAGDPVPAKRVPKGGHTISLDAGTVEMLRTHQRRQAEYKRLLGAAYEDAGWIFTRPAGAEPLHPERFSREFLRKQETYNRAHPAEPLPRLKLHGLRHTWATLALQEGIDIHVVSDRLAHSSTHITSEIYTHVTKPMQSDAADRVASRILGGCHGMPSAGG